MPGPTTEEVNFSVKKLATRLLIASLTGLVAALTMCAPAFAGFRWG